MQNEHNVLEVSRDHFNKYRIHDHSERRPKIVFKAKKGVEKEIEQNLGIFKNGRREKKKQRKGFWFIPAAMDRDEKREVVKKRSSALVSGSKKAKIGKSG